MSTRTIIEINHDCLHLLGHSHALYSLLADLAMSNIPAILNKEGPFEYANGIRILGQRHHSEPEWVQGK